MLVRRAKIVNYVLILCVEISSVTMIYCYQVMKIQACFKIDRLINTITNNESLCTLTKAV